jgi:REP element-mobilizing transposase RayT
MDNKFLSHPHRLPEDCYRGFVTVAYTCCVKGKKSIFITSDLIAQIQRILFTESIQCECDVLAYVVMLDHCHVLLQGKSENADTLKAIRRFKQKTG